MQDRSKLNLAKPLPGDVELNPSMLIPSLEDCALLFDIDGTLLEFAPTPSDVWVPPELQTTMNGLLKRTSGALALVSGRSIHDMDMIFAPAQFPSVGGHGAEMRVIAREPAVLAKFQPLDSDLKRRFARIADLSPGILLEDKDYSLALHFRLAPQAERAIYDAVSVIRADLPEAPIEVLPGKSVCEIKPPGFSKATGVRELLTKVPFKGRVPIFFGDDITDESVFAIMPDLHGFAFSVGHHAKGVTGHFANPQHVRIWLKQLLDCEGSIVS